MTLLNDLNPFSIIATSITVVVCAGAIFLDVRDRLNRWRIDGRRQFAILIWISLFCLLAAIYSFSPQAEGPRKTVAGNFRVVGAIAGRGVRTEIICLGDCMTTGGVKLAVNEAAFKTMANDSPGKRYVFEYLAQSFGNSIFGGGLRVVGIRDADSGAKLYEDDLVRHWGRTLLFAADLLLCLCTGTLCLVLKRAEKRGNWNSDERSDSEPKGGGNSELNLS